MEHDVRSFFCQCGLRCTKQRAGIYTALAATDSHPTADELYWLAREHDADLSLATVYNALEAFCENGLCRKLATENGPARYDADVSDHLHVQDADGTIHDVPQDLGRRIVEAIGPELINEIGRTLEIDMNCARIELRGLGDQPCDRSGEAPPENTGTIC